jgi:hypothetical protein
MKFKLIEKLSNINLEREKITGYELKVNVSLKQKGPAPVKGKRKSKKDKLREQALIDAKKEDNKIS